MNKQLSESSYFQIRQTPSPVSKSLLYTPQPRRMTRKWVPKRVEPVLANGLASCWYELESFGDAGAWGLGKSFLYIHPVLGVLIFLAHALNSKPPKKRWGASPKALGIPRVPAPPLPSFSRVHTRMVHTQRSHGYQPGAGSGQPARTG